MKHMLKQNCRVCRVCSSQIRQKQSGARCVYADIQALVHKLEQYRKLREKT